MKHTVVIYIILSIGVDDGMLISENKPIYLQCPPKHFRLNGMMNCHSWLSCSDISKMKIYELLGVGMVKDVYLALWEKHFVALSKLKNAQFVNDFQHGLNMLKLLNPSKYIVQLIGYCEKKHIIITEYHTKGNAVNVTNILKNMGKDSIFKRLNLCFNYVEILNYIHDGPGGTRVFCDSNDLFKLLSQLLVTEDLTLVLNDMDALPEVKANVNIICGHRELKGSFIAPEQLWNHNFSFNESMMNGYNEKTDIWKAVAVCNYFLKDIEGNEVALYRLFNIHRQCRNQDPSKRPTAKELVVEYIKILDELAEHEEL